VNQANLLLPNSKAEYQILQAELATRGQLVRVINYGFNVALARQAANQCDKRRGIVCAGRVEPRKNSCGVIRAFRRLTDADQNLSFFGSLNEAHGKFCEEFRTLLEPGRIDYGGRIAINDIYRKFASAKVVVLASFYETCGMVALEALACGANVVVMDSAYTREYYQDAVFYCDPYDEASIAKAMLEALASPPRPAPNWLDNYTWERAGRLTLEAYKQVLERKHPPTH
jgi:glycosyltransferase involved in cell wall biosynthesis